MMSFKFLESEKLPPWNPPFLPLFQSGMVSSRALRARAEKKILLRFGNLLAVLLVILAGCGERDTGRVVVYTSHDQVYSQPLLQSLVSEMGLEIGVVYDSEAVKTVGLANRLLAEREHPIADVWWSNEELRTRQLVARGVLASDPPWHHAGYRTRRLVINTNRIDLAEAPVRFQDLTNRIWRGRLAMAFPQFGTTATHFHYLRQRWGAGPWENWCRALAENDPLVVDGNSVVVRRVGAGEAVVGMTDWDDIEAGRRQGLPVASLPLAEDSMVIYATVAQVAGAPHPGSAQRLVKRLIREDLLQTLAGSALEGTGHPAGLPSVPDAVWSAMLSDLEAANQMLNRIFLR